MTDRDRLVERAERAEQWANLHGDDIAGALRLDDEMDADTIKVVEDALWCAHDVLALVAEREALLERIQELELQLLGGHGSAVSRGGGES